MVFEMRLPTIQIANVWRSEGPKTSKYAAQLQALYDQGREKEYEALEERFEKTENVKVRLTKGEVFQIFPSENTGAVPIKFQVKEGTITWYFETDSVGMDETHQDFRDQLYQSAALGHLTVPEHCDKYWRGTNSLHVKKMHTKEAESTSNHNHYRLEDDKDYNPRTVYQHLMGLVRAQDEMGLYDGDSLARGDLQTQQKFLTHAEAIELSHQYNVFYAKQHYVGPARSILVGKELVPVPETEVSLASQYKAKSKAAYTREDILEWEQNKKEEQPCKEVVPGLPLKQRLEAVKIGMRGIGSKYAQTRQMEGSKLKTATAAPSMGDKLVIQKIVETPEVQTTA